MKIEPTQLPECHEGPEASQRFDEGVKQILSVPHSLIVPRERAYKKKVAASPNRRSALSPPRFSWSFLFRLPCR
jgi:hypothetical protein